MKENVGSVDRMVRAVVGPALAALGYTTLGGNRGNLAGLAAIVGGALILDSAITRVCTVNYLLGIDTRSERQRMRDLDTGTGRTTWSPPATAPVRH